MLTEANYKRLALAVWLVLWALATGIILWEMNVAPLDLKVYLAGGRAWRQGLPLYVPEFAKPLNGPDLPFTYPPIAAVAFSVLTLIWTPLMVALWTLTGLAGLAAACLLASRSVHPNFAVLVSGLAAACLALASEPVRMTLTLGQINLLLMGMVAADCLIEKPPWPRGALIGLAAAIKLTPALFGVYYLARREWRPAIISAVAFFAATLLGHLLAPQDSAQYWLHALLDPGRVGNLEYTANQSIMGVLHRLGLRGSRESIAWVLLSLGVLSLIGIAAVRRRRAGEHLAGLIAVAIGCLLISPISWSHHWVWIGPALLLLVPRENFGKVRDYALAGAVLFLFVISPHWWCPHERVAWTWWQHILGNAYVWLGVAGLIWLARRADPATQAPALEPAPQAN